MEFRWLVFLALWTAFAGPVLSRPALAAPPKPSPSLAADARFPNQTTVRAVFAETLPEPLHDRSLAD